MRRTEKEKKVMAKANKMDKVATNKAMKAKDTGKTIWTRSTLKQTASVHVALITTTFRGRWLVAEELDQSYCSQVSQ